jgi:ABC-type multidrug transport system fused ATPase/permease subunit
LLAFLAICLVGVARGDCPTQSASVAPGLATAREVAVLGEDFGETFVATDSFLTHVTLWQPAGTDTVPVPITFLLYDTNASGEPLRYNAIHVGPTITIGTGNSAGPVAVEFDDVRFAYPSADKVSLASLEEVSTLDTRGGVEVLHGISFRAEPGEMVALVGTSGAGKSTIAQLVPRLYDADQGEIRIAGSDIRDLSTDSVRATIGMVTQDGHLFHESVRANLLLARPEATEAELWQVLERARLQDLVTSLPDGLDTVVGERGYRLSGGERQRLTIARLLLAHPRVVILDEATAHLDSTSEASVQAALTEALAGRTSIVIAHRLSTVRAADQILVVEDGRIVQRGTHADLLAQGGRYEELYRTQFDQKQTGEKQPVAAHH